MQQATIFTLIVSNLQEIISKSKDPYAVYVAQVTLRAIEENQ